MSTSLSLISRSIEAIFMNKDILDVIIGYMLFQRFDLDGIYKPPTLSLFKLCESNDDDVNSGEEYSVVIKTTKRFSLTIGIIARGVFFRIAAQILQLVHDEGELSLYSGCSNVMASNYARMVYAASLKIIVEALNKTSRFLPALDVSNLHEIPFPEVCAPFFLYFEMHIFMILQLVYSIGTPNR